MSQSLMALVDNNSMVPVLFSSAIERMVMAGMKKNSVQKEILKNTSSRAWPITNMLLTLSQSEKTTESQEYH